MHQLREHDAGTMIRSPLRPNLRVGGVAALGGRGTLRLALRRHTENEGDESTRGGESRGGSREQGGESREGSRKVRAEEGAEEGAGRKGGGSRGGRREEGGESRGGSRGGWQWG